MSISATASKETDETLVELTKRQCTVPLPRLAADNAN